MSQTLHILYENDDLLVINKPAGLVVHPDGKSDEETLCDILVENYPSIKEVGEPITLQNGTIIARPGIVHRLDRDTSGCLVVAKTQEAFLFLKEQFQNHTIQKRYMAWVYGSPKEDQGVIDAPLGRSTGDVRKWATSRSTRGILRDAITSYHVLGRYGRERERATTEDGTYSLLELFPKTGRTHQIRVHLKHLNHPIISDMLYAPKRKPALGFLRLALHAESITFSDLKGEKQTIHAPLPEDFIAAAELAEKSNLC
jgi:23S rRNA pseudouridine1911/1915/1917 synthase